MFTVTQVNNCSRGLIKCGPPFDGAVVLVPARDCAFQPSTSPKWMKHLVMVMGGNWCFWDRLNTQMFLLLPFLLSFLFLLLTFFFLACVGVLNKLQKQNKSQEMYFECHGIR